MPTRREFVATSAAMLAAYHVRPASPLLLFQGDSITDAGRDRSPAAAGTDRALGGGYPLVISRTLAAQTERPEQARWQIMNRGVSGNTVDDLEKRWDADTLNLKPVVLSILIGVNDIWHTLTGTYNGTPEKYEAGYAALPKRTKAALPNVQLIVMEPFVLRIGAVNDTWFPAFDQFRAASRRVASGANATFVELHDMFQDLAKKGTPAEWAADGVHPTAAGHKAIAEQWLKVAKAVSMW